MRNGSSLWSTIGATCQRGLPMDSKKPHDAAILSELGRWDGGRRGTSTKVRFDGFPDAAASTRLFFSTGSSDPSIATFPMRLAARTAPPHSNNPKRCALNPPFGVVFVVPPHRKRCGAAQRMLSGPLPPRELGERSRRGTRRRFPAEGGGLWRLRKRPPGGRPPLRL